MGDHSSKFLELHSTAKQGHRIIIDITVPIVRQDLLRSLEPVTVSSDL